VVGEECLNWGVDKSVEASHLEGPRGEDSTACAVLDKVVDEGCRPAYKPGPFGSEWNWLGGEGSLVGLSLAVCVACWAALCCLTSVERR
jgi:hypothetical protein